MSSEATQSFYDRALDEAERRELEAARKVEGLDDEIALLRVAIARLLADEEEVDWELLQTTVRALAATLVTRHRISPRAAEGIADAAAELLEQFGAMLQEP